MKIIASQQYANEVKESVSLAEQRALLAG